MLNEVSYDVMSKQFEINSIQNFKRKKNCVSNHTKNDIFN